jgi:hypothetical protein
MAYRSDDRTRFDRAKELARQIVADSRQSDAISLVSMASPSRAILSTPTFDHAEVLREIDALSLSQTAADLPSTIETVRKILDHAHQEKTPPALHEIIFLTDMQRDTWTAKGSEQQIQSLSKTTSLRLVDVADPSAENVAVTRLQTEGPLTVDHPIRIQAELKNFGRRPRVRQPVELIIDGRPTDRRDPDIAPNGTASAEFSYRFLTPADHTIEVRTSGDALDLDNHRYLVFPVRESIRVLCVTGRSSHQPFSNAADYLSAALNPFDQTTAHRPIRMDVIHDGIRIERNLADYDCVFLCDVTQFTPDEAKQLDAYLQSGGSLIFFLGDRVDAASYRQIWTDSGQGRGPGVSPVTIGPLVEQPQFRLDPLAYRHPIVQSFRGPGETSLLTTPIFKHYKLTVPNDAAAQIVIALPDGDPWIVESPLRRGRVILIATSPEPSWSGLPLWPSFVPLMQEMVDYCAEGRFRRHNETIGQTIDLLISAPTVHHSASVRSPDGRQRALPLRTIGDDSILHDSDTNQSGFYTVMLDPPTVKPMFAVNLNTAESNLARVEASELRNTRWPGVSFVYDKAWQEPRLSKSPELTSQNRSLHLGLLYAVLALLLIELLLAATPKVPSPLARRLG